MRYLIRVVLRLRRPRPTPVEPVDLKAAIDDHLILQRARWRAELELEGVVA